MHQFRLPTNISILIQDRIPNTPSIPSVVIIIILLLLLISVREASKTVFLVRAVKDKLWLHSGGADLRTGNQRHHQCSLPREPAEPYASLGAHVQPSGEEGNQCLPPQHLLLAAQRWTGVRKREFWLWIISDWPTPSLKRVILTQTDAPSGISTFVQKSLDFSLPLSLPPAVSSLKLYLLSCFYRTIFFLKPYSKVDTDVFLNILLQTIPILI